MLDKGREKRERERERREARLVDEQQRFRLMNRRNSSGQLAGVPALALMASRSICFQSVNCTPADSSSIDPRREITPCTVDTRNVISFSCRGTFSLSFSSCDSWSITHCLPFPPIANSFFFFLFLHLSLLPSSSLTGSWRWIGRNWFLKI